MESYVVEELSSGFYVIKTAPSNMPNSPIAVGSMDFLTEFVENHRIYKKSYNP